jgi:uncharacterized protein YijF (DUF1287 family)
MLPPAPKMRGLRCATRDHAWNFSPSMQRREEQENWKLKSSESKVWQRALLLALTRSQVHRGNPKQITHLSVSDVIMPRLATATHHDGMLPYSADSQAKIEALLR